MTDTRERDHDEFEEVCRVEQVEDEFEQVCRRMNEIEFEIYKEKLQRQEHPCPKCSSMNTVKAGSLIRKRGKVPARICKGCGYRGPAEWFVEKGEDGEER